MSTLVICNNENKKYILNYLNDKPIININFMTKKEFINNYYFKYNEKTIYYLMNKYHYKYDVCLNYLNNLYYIEDKKYNSHKLNKLVSLKKELDEKELLIYNPLFKSYLNNKKIIFLDKVTKFDKLMLNKLDNVEIKTKEIKNYNPNVYEFNTIDEEVDFVAHKICELIDKGISADKIKITNINQDYVNPIKRIFKNYNLKIQDKINLFGLNITKYFLNNYHSDINKSINLLKGKYPVDLINKIINIVNKYNFIDDYMLVKDLIVEDLKNTNIVTNYTNQIEMVDYHNIFEDEYIFMLNFNEESIPIKYQDIDYITDNIKPSYLETTKEKNISEKEMTINCLKSIKNLTITYKLKTPFNSFYPSSLIKDMNLTVIKPSINHLKSYSKTSDQIKTCMMIDDYFKYGIYNKKLDLYYSNYHIPYNVYSNKFSKIKLIIDNLLLSYTSMNDYYKCRFKYYLKYILKIDKSDNNLSKYIGSIFHYVLEKGLNNEVDINKLISEYLILNNISLTIKERYYLEKLKEELPKIIEVIKHQDKLIKLKQRLYEEKVIVEFGSSKFMGVIDKVMHDDNVYAIVDYKTGNTDINLNLSKYGIGMQLPVYLYLAHKKFGGNIAGFYLEQILHGNLKYDIKMSYEDKYKDNLKLYGYSNYDYISDFDITYQDSSLIKSLRTKKDGSFYQYSKILNNDEINDLIELVEDKIIECIDDIKKGKFDINPKNINGKNIGCEYCPYKDICFMDSSDIVYLGGEENA